jgi:hypothetical protein
MWFKFFKHKKKEDPKTYEGRFISDEEIDEMTRPKNGTFIKKEFEEINKMMEELKKSIE